MRGKRTTIAVLASALIAAGVLAVPGPARGDTATLNKVTIDRPAAEVAFEPGSGQIAVQWNQELLGIEGAQPTTVHTTRSFALLNTAVYDAVVSTTRADAPYQFSVVASRDARPDAAAEQAAHDTLLALFPTKASLLDQLLSTQLARIPDSPAKQSGIVVGSRAATILLALRANDGSSNSPTPFVPSNPPQPGGYQLTPPNNAAPVFTNWGSINPWVLDAGNQFRPPAPPPLTSPEWPLQ